MTRPRALTGGLAAVLLLAAGCSGSAGPPPEPPEPTAPPSAEQPPPAPEKGACYRLGFKDALAPTNDRAPRPCAQPHTSETYAVGTLDTRVEGHLVAVDSERVQAQVAAACPAELSPFLGGDLDDLRLSMLRPVWFTPTVEESDAGADWYRCDAVVVDGRRSLAPLEGSLAGVLDRTQGRDAYAMCATAAPDADDFIRVPCSEEHTWRAIDVVTFEAVRAYPGQQAARERGQAQCENAALDVAEDPLEFDWGYEWPTAEQWDMGQQYGRCWAPD
jgi:hypothetical protein